MSCCTPAVLCTASRVCLERGNNQAARGRWWSMNGDSRRQPPTAVTGLGSCSLGRCHQRGVPGERFSLLLFVTLPHSACAVSATIEADVLPERSSQCVSGYTRPAMREQHNVVYAPLISLCGTSCNKTPRPHDTREDMHWQPVYPRANSVTLSHGDMLPWPTTVYPLCLKC